MHRAFGRLIFGVFLGLLLGKIVRRRRARHWARGHFDPDGYPGWERRGGPHHHEHHPHH
ncbi:MAG TPA: hypothetical protein VKT82_14100 [Ktedonobacterales bacterium]|nr:hypothetical protein [Ktedonobacterales bacterium]